MVKYVRNAFCGLTTVLVMSATTAASQDFVHKFTNPSFGGDPFIGTYLFGLAEAQKTATIPDTNATSQGGQIPGIGGGSGGDIGGPTIIIPSGDFLDDGLTVDADAGGTSDAGQ